jgi:hypothetical protein
VVIYLEATFLHSAASGSFLGEKGVAISGQNRVCFLLLVISGKFGSVAGLL